MKFSRTIIPDVMLIEPTAHHDDRGFFLENWNAVSFSENGIAANFVQDSHSRSQKGVLRGLHYQVEHPQGKLIRVVEGEIFDVVLDIRRSSPSFGQVVCLCLKADSNQALWVPPGFAHGFYVTSDHAEVLYKQTAYYAPAHERCILWSDPDLSIPWPLISPPTLSEKDKGGSSFRCAEYLS